VVLNAASALDASSTENVELTVVASAPAADASVRFRFAAKFENADASFSTMIVSAWQHSSRWSLTVPPGCTKMVISVDVSPQTVLRSSRTVVVVAPQGRSALISAATSLSLSIDADFVARDVLAVFHKLGALAFSVEEIFRTSTKQSQQSERQVDFILTRLWKQLDDALEMFKKSSLSSSQQRAVFEALASVLRASETVSTKSVDLQKLAENVLSTMESVFASESHVVHRSTLESAFKVLVVLGRRLPQTLWMTYWNRAVKMSEKAAESLVCGQDFTLNAAGALSIHVSTVPIASVIGGVPFASGESGIKIQAGAYVESSTVAAGIAAGYLAAEIAESHRECIAVVTVQNEFVPEGLIDHKVIDQVHSSLVTHSVDSGVKPAPGAVEVTIRLADTRTAGTHVRADAADLHCFVLGTDSWAADCQTTAVSDSSITCSCSRSGTFVAGTSAQSAGPAPSLGTSPETKTSGGMTAWQISLVVVGAVAAMAGLLGVGYVARRRSMRAKAAAQQPQAQDLVMRQSLLADVDSSFEENA
jgi:hypothetical protein